MSETQDSVDSVLHDVVMQLRMIGIRWPASFEATQEVIREVRRAKAITDHMVALDAVDWPVADTVVDTVKDIDV